MRRHARPTWLDRAFFPLDILSAAAHELGHVLAMYALGSRPRHIRLGGGRLAYAGTFGRVRIEVRVGRALDCCVTRGRGRLRVGAILVLFLAGPLAQLVFGLGCGIAAWLLVRYASPVFAPFTLAAYRLAVISLWSGWVSLNPDGPRGTDGEIAARCLFRLLGR